MITFTRAWLLLGAAAPLAGCITLGPDFETPEAEVAAEWLGGADDRVVPEPGEYAEWWKVFGDPVLESLVARTHAESPTLQVAGLRVYEARAILGFAAGTFYPQVQQAAAAAGALDLSENAEPVVNLPSPVHEGVDTSFGNFRPGFDAAWELDFWGGFRRAVESLDASGNVHLIPNPYWFLHSTDEAHKMGLPGLAAIHSSPWAYDTYVPIFFAGGNLSPRTVARRVSPTDIAATIGAYLGIKYPSGCVGTPLAEVLE